MKAKLVIFLVLIAAALLLLSVNTLFAQEATVSIDSEDAVVPTAVPSTDIAVHGSMWKEENKGKFQNFKSMGWGTFAKVKAAGTQWVHLAIPYITYLNDIPKNIQYVQFCAQSSAGATTKPIRIDIWGGKTRIFTGPITWPADNDYHCVGVTFTPSIWKEDLGVSVQLQFANTTDSITLYKTWARFE